MPADLSVALNLSRDTQTNLELCKMALERAKQDVDLAKTIIKRWGYNPTQAEKPDTIDIHGIIRTGFDPDVRAASIVEAKCNNKGIIFSKDFKELIDNIAYEVACYEQPYLNEDKIKQIEQESGSKINLTSLQMMKSEPNSLLTTYTHHDNIGVLVETVIEHESAITNSKFKMFSFDLAMHIAAFNPIGVDKGNISPDARRNMFSRLEKQMLEEGKDMRLWETIISGKIKKWEDQCTLLNQIFIKSDTDTVDSVRKSVSDEIHSDISIKRFVRFAL